MPGGEWGERWTIWYIVGMGIALESRLGLVIRERLYRVFLVRKLCFYFGYCLQCTEDIQNIRHIQPFSSARVLWDERFAVEMAAPRLASTYNCLSTATRSRTSPRWLQVPLLVSATPQWPARRCWPNRQTPRQPLPSARTLTRPARCFGSQGGWLVLPSRSCSSVQRGKVS